MIINTYDNFMSTYGAIVCQHEDKREDYLNAKKKHEELEQEHQGTKMVLEDNWNQESELRKCGCPFRRASDVGGS